MTVLVLGGAGAWWYYGGTMPGFVRTAASKVAGQPTAVTSKPVVWASASDARITASDALASLERPTGPAYVTLAPGDVAAFLANALKHVLPGSVEGAQVAIVDDQVRLRAAVPLREMGGGALSALLKSVLSRRTNDERNETAIGGAGHRDTVELGGTLEIIRPGLGQFRVHEFRVQDVGVPSRLIPTLLAAMRKRDALSDSTAADAVPVTLPAAVADVRVSHGKMTLYKRAKQ